MARSSIRVTVCELEGNLDQLDREWESLVQHTRRSGSEVVLLPELPFGPWLAATRDVDAARWQSSVELHERWIGRLGELGARWVVMTRPVVTPEGRFNESIVWDAETGVHPSRRKTYLPEEEGFWEASWYRRGAVRFESMAGFPQPAGVMICTEMWYFEHARAYAREGVELLLCPRATELRTVDKWIAGGRAAAVSSGAYCLSSNWWGPAAGTMMGGAGWIIDPDGTLLARTSRSVPHVTLDLALEPARAAKKSYPRYVLE